jgi:hypothetical protein
MRKRQDERRKYKDRRKQGKETEKAGWGERMRQAEMG